MMRRAGRIVRTKGIKGLTMVDVAINLVVKRQSQVAKFQDIPRGHARTMQPPIKLMEREHKHVERSK